VPSRLAPVDGPDRKCHQPLALSIPIDTAAPGLKREKSNGEKKFKINYELSTDIFWSGREGRLNFMETFDLDFETFIHDLQAAGLVRQDREKLEAFRFKYRRELVFVSIYLNDFGVTGGANLEHSDPPESCDLCGKTEFGFFVDGATASGEWANMCPHCFFTKGCGLGWGIGQLFRQVADGRWQCVAGGDPALAD
jgi:hypothetical protein